MAAIHEVTLLGLKFDGISVENFPKLSLFLQGLDFNKEQLFTFCYYCPKPIREDEVSESMS